MGFKGGFGGELGGSTDAVDSISCEAPEKYTLVDYTLQYFAHVYLDHNNRV